jgi:nitrogenase molybdenum-iron protein alpha chain
LSVDLQNPEVVIRERRLGSIVAFSGTGAELVEKSRGQRLECQANRFNQCGDCSGQRAMLPISQIQDTVMINHGPVGCAGDFGLFNWQFRRGLTFRGERPRDIGAISTNLTERDIVYGGAEKLAKTIREAHGRYKPRAIFVASSCASGIIGDDIEEVVNGMELELGIPVVGVYCEGFKSKIWTTGFDAAYHGIVRKLVKGPVEIDKKTVNIMGFTSLKTFDPLLGLLGLKPRYLVHQATLEEIGQMSQALASSHICETLGTYLARALEQEYGVPELRAPPPFGQDWTDQWLRELGRLAGLEEKAEEVIASERKRIEPELNEIREKLAGLRVWTLAGAAFGHNLASIASDLGLKVIGMLAFHHDQTFDNDYEEINSLKNCLGKVGSVNRYAVCNKQPYQLVNLLNEAKPDLVLARHGYLPTVPAKMGIPSYFVPETNQHIGYDGLLFAGRKILKVLRGGNFVKNIASRAKLPYTDWWRNSDPFYFRETSHGL